MLQPRKRPEALRHILDWFEELSAVRTYTMAGPQPISHAEIAAWSNLHGIGVLPEEVRFLKMLDMAYLSAAAESMSERNKPSKGSKDGKV